MSVDSFIVIKVDLKLFNIFVMKVLISNKDISSVVIKYSARRINLIKLELTI